jgi:transcriptional regulator with XRE-family HTH domain
VRRRTSRLQAGLATVVRSALSEDGATQSDLARHLGVSQKHVSRLLNGRDEGSLSQWSRMLDLCGVDVVDLPLPEVVPFLGALREPVAS